MTQFYTEPNRENDAHSLPDAEAFYISEGERADICEGNGEWHTQQPSTRNPCEDCPPAGWYWWSCFPGCLPDSEPNGTFETKSEAIADAQSNSLDEEEDEEGMDE